MESWTPKSELVEISNFDELELFHLGSLSSPDIHFQYLPIFPLIIQSTPNGKLFQLKPPSAYSAFKALVSFKFLPIILTRGYS